MIAGKQVDQTKASETENLNANPKKTKNGKDGHQLQKSSAFQTSRLPAIGKSDINAPNLIKPSKVHPIDFDGQQRKTIEGKSLDDSVPQSAGDVASIVTTSIPVRRLASPLSEGLVVSRNNKVHPQKSEKSFTSKTALTDQEQCENQDLVELQCSDLTTQESKSQSYKDDEPWVSSV